MYKIGFDNDKYLSMQSSRIRERINEFGGKLYLEFGGKLFDDYHASRVLPGFQPDSKLQMLLQLKDEAEVVIAISAQDIEKSKLRGDLGITYDDDVVRLIKEFGDVGLMVGSVVLTKYSPSSKVVAFEERLKKLGYPVYHHYVIGKNDYIKTSRQLVVVTAPGPGSGKMATCLSQLYHENKRDIKAGYAKFETFPIWNIPLNHSVNVAYEAATADLNDVNMIDPWHLDAYGETTVNYNRDVEIFPVLKATFDKIYGECPYKSPTDMGVNMAGNCICDNDACEEASKQEIIRRYFTAICANAKGANNDDEIFKLELLMNQAKISVNDRACTALARKREAEIGSPISAIELNDNTVITGKTSNLLGCTAAMLLNALKHLANIDDDVLLILPEVIKPIQNLKVNHLKCKNPRLHTDEVLIALSISATTDKNAALALQQLPKLKNTEVHSTVMLSQVDKGVLNKLGIRLTCDNKR
jgi:uncharacterized protein (UPF0371 family)